MVVTIVCKAMSLNAEESAARLILLHLNPYYIWTDSRIPVVSELSVLALEVMHIGMPASAGVSATRGRSVVIAELPFPFVCLSLLSWTDGTRQYGNPMPVLMLIRWVLP